MGALILLALWIAGVFLVSFLWEFIPSARQIRYELQRRRAEDEQKPPSDGPVG